MEQAKDAHSTTKDAHQKVLKLSPFSLPSSAPRTKRDNIPLSLSPSIPNHPADRGLPTGPNLLTLPSRPLPAVKIRNFSKDAPSGPKLLTLPSWPSSATRKKTLPRVPLTHQQDAPPGRKSSEAPPEQAQEKGQKQQSPTRRKRPWRRVPELRQMNAVECGACCLAMILNYHGCATSVSQVQERCGVGRDGLSALAIARAARQYGLRVRAVSLKKNDARFVTFPAIVHWMFNHFIVVERWSSKHVDVVDPAMGRKRLTLEEFEEGFTGVLIMLEPGADFERQASARSLSLWTYLQSLPHMYGIVAQIIGTSLLLQFLGLGTPLLTGIIVDQIIPASANALLLMLGAGMLFLILIQGIMKLLRTSLLIYLQVRIDSQMMLTFFEHLLKLPYRFFQMRLNGDLLARVDSNTAIRELLTSQMVSTLLDGCSVIIYLIVLISQSTLIAGVTLAIGAFQVGLLLATAPAIRRLTMRDLAAQGKTEGYLNEVLAGIATVKAAGAEQRTLNRWTNLFFAEMNISIRRNYLMSVVAIIFEVLQLLSPLLLLWIGAIQVINKTMSIGTMFALNTLAVSFLVPLSSLAASGQKIQVARAHFDRLADVLASKPEQDLQQAFTPPKLRGAIDLRNISFQYDPHMSPVLNNISLRIWPGQKVALVGKTGSGKSTLGKLLIGLITPTEGDILFDGIPLQQLNYQEVRRQFGVVLQEAFIFSGSVRENISFNDPEMEMAQIIKAAKAAAIHDDIEKMPMGYETLLSEGGSVFSGGQRQRLALARALANYPALLLLDEATSALDVTTERAVEQSLNRLPCTQLVIAHRLSTIRNADLILVLDQGHLVEQGTHHQLLQRRGFYAQLIKIQVENGEIEVA
ncbi:MAG TPA: peptidase domain-containing ABC transporter [Ktedonobacteraceae bacterium]|nr:peptidase domain-containing ABC transporter [Ktedonobacteraceae bacterium]